MKYKLFSLLFALTIFLGCKGQDPVTRQNLCDFKITRPNDDSYPPADENGDVFVKWVKDPSHCSRYLYCRRDQKGDLVSVLQLDCRVNQNHPYFHRDSEKDGECVDKSTKCPYECSELEEFNVFMVAVTDDPTCTRFFPCQYPPLIMTCAQGLLFNRATGQCVLPSVAPCSDLDITRPECPRGPNGEMDVNGFFPGSFCHSFIMCINSVIQPPELHCAVGQKFVPNPNDPLQSGRCEIDTAGTCDHSTNPTVPQNDFIIPQAPTRSIRSPRTYFEKY